MNVRLVSDEEYARALASQSHLHCSRKEMLRREMQYTDVCDPNHDVCRVYTAKPYGRMMVMLRFDTHLGHRVLVHCSPKSRTFQLFHIVARELGLSASTVKDRVTLTLETNGEVLTICNYQGITPTLFEAGFGRFEHVTVRVDEQTWLTKLPQWGHAFGVWRWTGPHFRGTRP